MRLLSPLALGPLTLRNRVVMPAMDPSLAGEDGRLLPLAVEHYARRARGGAGLIITGNVACRLDGRVSNRQATLHDDAQRDGFAALAAAVKAEGAALFVQLSHAGRQTLSDTIGTLPIAPTPLPCPLLRECPRPLLTDEVFEVADDFAAAALRAKEAGADGVEFHMAHGYLVCQFLSPYSNLRTDVFGEDEAGRARLAVEILRRTRALVGERFPLQCRLSADERVPGGITPPLALAYAHRLVDAGATSLSISACNYESYRYNMPAYYQPEATFADLAGFVRRGLAGAVPIVAVGRLARPEVAEAVLARGDADLVAIGRGLLADPDLPNKLKTGRRAQIRPCLACNRCAESVTVGPIRCLVNPTVGRAVGPRTRAEDPKKIAVIGGGPAGLTFALEAKKRGHAVTVYEARERLGGLLFAGAAPPEKEALAALAAWYLEEVARVGLDCRLGEKISPETLAALDADLIVAAVGAEPNRLPEGLVRGVPVAYGLHELPATPLGAVVVVGGGPEGCEVADALSQRPERPAVTLIEKRRKVGLGLPSSVRALLEERLEAQGVVCLTRCTLGEVSPEGLTVLDARGRPLPIQPAPDLVVVAIGLHAPETWTSLNDPRLRCLGDCQEPATLQEAIHSAFDLARTV